MCPEKLLYVVDFLLKNKNSEAPEEAQLGAVNSVPGGTRLVVKQEMAESQQSGSEPWRGSVMRASYSLPPSAGNWPHTP